MRAVDRCQLVLLVNDFDCQQPLHGKLAVQQCSTMQKVFYRRGAVRLGQP